MKHIVFQFITAFLMLITAQFATAAVPQEIKLNQPDLTRGVPMMQAFSQRASVKEFNSEALKLQDLSDLTWAAFGINRPESGNRTAPSALNSQDVDLFLFMQAGVYLYNAEKHSLMLWEAGDHRKLVAGAQAAVATAPVLIVLVSDSLKFPDGFEAKAKEWGAISTGLISQNISLFCAATELVTRPRATMDREGIAQLLELSEFQFPLLNHPVSYTK